MMLFVAYKGAGVKFFCRFNSLYGNKVPLTVKGQIE